MGRLETAKSVSLDAWTLLTNWIRALFCFAKFHGGRNNAAAGRPKFFVVVLTLLLAAVHAPQALAESDESIKLVIERKAAATPDLSGTEVRVAVEDGGVILYGSVRLYHQRMLFEKIAWQTKGVAEVDNEIRIVPQAPLSDAEIEQQISEIVRLHQQFHDSKLRVRVTGGAVFLDATFHHPIDVLFLKRRVAVIEGVVAIQIEIRFWV